MNQKQAVLFLGDSLTYGYQMGRSETLPALIQDRINKENLNWFVINGGVNGDTVDMATRRIDYYFEQYKSIKLVVIFLGANDLLMGEDINLVEQDFRNLILKIRSLNSDIEIRLVAFGQLKGFDVSYLKPDYMQQFQEIYKRISTEMNVKLIPFPMVDVVGRPNLNLEDGLHPNQEGYRIIANQIWPYLKDDFQVEK
ncbi:MAG: hypothetical protein H3C43_01000 [Leptonema sp. (in: Bacteria)]|nr:hypothetical protein [Leptonema sp. (in: bacteria)]